MDKFLHVAEEQPDFTEHLGWVQVTTAHTLGWSLELVSGSAPLPLLWVFHELLVQKEGRGQRTWSF